MARTYKHKEIQVKQNLLQLAKDFSAKSDAASQLAGSLLYINFADYLSSALLKLLSEQVEEASRRYYLGEITVTLRGKKKPQTLGDVIKDLKKFNFPSQAEVINVLEKINKARIPVVHNIAKTPLEKMPEVDKSVKDVQKYTEELVNLTDELFNQIMPQVPTIVDIAKPAQPETSATGQK